MKLIQMVMIPLVITSIITGILSNSNGNLKSMGFKLLAYFILTTIVAISIGTILTLFFKPGNLILESGGFPGMQEHQSQAGAAESPIHNIPQLIANLIPANPLEAILSGEMLAIVIFTVLIGIAVSQLELTMARPIARFIEAIQKVCMVVVGWAMNIVPFAVFGLMAALLSRIGFEIFIGLGYYMLVVLLGLFLMLLVYMAVVLAVGKRNPFQFFRSIKDAQLLAFSTASSAAVMPLSMKIADEELHVSSNVSDFIIPVGATINMDGTAIFQCITTLFMAQAYGIELSIANILLLTVTVVAASVGTPAIPGGGVLILSSVLGSAGIPVDGLLVIIGIDRILGMFRTAVNVTGDLTATVVFNRYFGQGSEHSPKATSQ